MADPEKQKPKLPEAEHVAPAETSDKTQLNQLRLQTEMEKEHLRIKKDIDLHLKYFFDTIKGVSEQKKAELYRRAESESTTLIELQMGHKWLDAKPEEKYAKLSSLYLEYTSSNIKESFKVSAALDKDPRVKMSIGAAHLLPPNVIKIRIIDTKGRARIGVREIRDGRVGYYDDNGYMPIYGGYQIDPLEILDPHLDDAKKRFGTEQKISKQKLEEFESAKKRDLEDDLPGTLDAMTTATKEDLEKKYDAPRVEMVLKGKDSYTKATQIFAYNGIKIDSDSAIQGARGFYGLNVEDLGWQEGKTLDQMDTQHNRVIQLLKSLQHGGTLEGYNIRGGYLLNYVQLPELIFLAKTEGRLRSVLESIKTEDMAKGGNGLEIASARVIEYIFDKGVDVMDKKALQELVRKNPKMQHLVDPKWGIDAYMEGSWIRRGSAIKGIHYPTDADLNAGRDQEVVGNKCCAYTVSNYLNLSSQGFGNEWSAPRLTMRLIKGGGKVLTSVSETERGDVIVTKGTTDTAERQQITHVLLTRDVCRMPSGGKLIIIQDNSKDLGIKFVADNSSDRKNLTKMVSEVKTHLAGASPADIEKIVRRHGFNESDVKKITSSFVYRQKFPNTIRINTAGSDYYTNHLYAVIRPNYRSDSVAQRDPSEHYGEAKRGRISDHA